MLSATVVLAVDIFPTKPKSAAMEYWIRKRYGKQQHDVLLLGDSRSFQGIDPRILQKYIPSMNAYCFGFSAGSINLQLLKEYVPKRLKRNAKFSFKPEWYIDTNGSKHNLNETVKATYTTTLNKVQLAKKAVLGVGNHFVKGLSMGVAAVEGVVENEEGNRLKSGAKSVYDASPLSYSEKGKDIVINENEIFYLKFPNKPKQ